MQSCVWRLSAPIHDRISPTGHSLSAQARRGHTSAGRSGRSREPSLRDRRREWPWPFPRMCVPLASPAVTPQGTLLPECEMTRRTRSPSSGTAHRWIERRIQAGQSAERIPSRWREAHIGQTPGRPRPPRRLPISLLQVEHSEPAARCSRSISAIVLEWHPSSALAGFGFWGLRP